MKIVVTFKDPEALFCAINDLPEDVQDEYEKKLERVREKYFRYGEYCDLEVDLKAGTVRVLEVNK